MKNTRTEVLVGTFVIFGFILLSLVVFFVSGVQLVKAGYRVTVVFHYVSILDKGAPVRMAGVRVGEVQKVILTEDKETGQMKVDTQLYIAKGIEIRENYLFHVRGTHILSEPHIEISPEPGNAPFLKNGSVVRGVDPVPIEALIDKAEEIASHLEAIFGRLKSALEDKQAESDLRTTMTNLAGVTRSLNKILSGSEGELVASIQNLKTSSDALEGILVRMDKGEGTMGKLLQDDALYTDMRELVQEIKAHPWRLLKRDDDKKKGVPGIPFV